MSKRKAGPRPVVVGTCTLAPFQHPDGNAGRLADGLVLVDRMAARARAENWALDLVVLPEHFAQHDHQKRSLEEEAEPLDGPLVAALAQKARQHKTYVALSMLLAEGGRFHNAVVFLDRQGRHVGRYLKQCPVLLLDGSLERGVTPWHETPTFDLDFGRVGAQICIEAFFDDGWQALDSQGVELVVFPSATSGVMALRSQAWRHQCYIVASTFRAPAVMVDPLGREIARTAGDKEVLVARFDLDYRVLPWNSLRDFGVALGRKYAARIRQNWDREEDMCLVTSLDPKLPVGEFLKRENLETHRQHLARNRAAHEKARGGS